MQPNLKADDTLIQDLTIKILLLMKLWVIALLEGVGRENLANPVAVI